MSVYRRNKEMTRCQKWDADQGIWRDCLNDAPETEPRAMRDGKPIEGMIVQNDCVDFESKGPLIISIDQLIASLNAEAYNIRIDPPKQRAPKYKGVHAYYFTYFEDVTDFLDGRARDCGVYLTVVPPLRAGLQSMNGHDLRGPWYSYKVPMRVWNASADDFEIDVKKVLSIL